MRYGQIDEIWDSREKKDSGSKTVNNPTWFLFFVLTTLDSKQKQESNDAIIV